jgi:hypothetical protein
MIKLILLNPMTQDQEKELASLIIDKYLDRGNQKMLLFKYKVPRRSLLYKQLGSRYHNTRYWYRLELEERTRRKIEADNIISKSCYEILEHIPIFNIFEFFICNSSLHRIRNLCEDTNFLTVTIELNHNSPPVEPTEESEPSEEEINNQDKELIIFE